MRKKLFLITIFTMFFLIIPLNINASYDAMIKGSQVRIRTGAGTNYEAIYSLGENTPITVLDKTKITGNGCSAGWLKVSYDNKEGYVCSSNADDTASQRRTVYICRQVFRGCYNEG